MTKSGGMFHFNFRIKFQIWTKRSQSLFWLKWCMFLTTIYLRSEDGIFFQRFSNSNNFNMVHILHNIRKTTNFNLVMVVRIKYILPLLLMWKYGQNGREKKISLTHFSSKQNLACVSHIQCQAKESIILPIQRKKNCFRLNRYIHVILPL